MRTLLISLASLLAAATTAQAEVPWRADLSDAYQAAKAERKPILLHFYRDNCPVCQTVLRDPRVAAALTSQFIPLKVSADSAPAIVNAFGVQQFPSDVIVTEQGQILSHQASPRQPDAYLEMLRRPWTAGRSSQPPQGADAAPAVNASPAATSSASATGPVPSQTAGYALPPGDEITARPTSNRTPQNDNLDSSQQTDAGTDTPIRVTEKRPLLDGFCPVTMVLEERWAPGDPQLGVIHLGELYLFATAEARDKFMESPKRFAPMLNGMDVVQFIDEQRVVPGVRDYGYVDPIYNRVFLFSSEASAKRFYENFQRYAPAAIKIMERAAADANPQR